MEANFHCAKLLVEQQILPSVAKRKLRLTNLAA
jgi:hypothetical protein